MNNSGVVLAVRERSDNPMTKSAVASKAQEQCGDRQRRSFLYWGGGVATSYALLKHLPVEATEAALSHSLNANYAKHASLARKGITTAL